MTMQNIEGEKDPLTAKIEEVSSRPDNEVLRDFEGLQARQGDLEGSIRTKVLRESFSVQVTKARLLVARDELANNVGNDQPKP